jgi:hypothetical protein
MAQYKTNAEATQALAKSLQTKARELKGIYDSTNPKEQARAEQLKSEIGAIQNQIMMSQDGVTGMFGSLGGGLAKGVVSAVTGIPDLAVMASNYLSGNKAQLLGDRMSPGLETTKENALLFGVGKGLGSSVGTGKVFTALQTGATTFDELAAGGDPMAQSLLAIGAISKGGVDGVRNLLKNRQVNKLMSQLGPEEANALEKYMVKGQSSTDPLVAGIVARLRSNPKYSELFTVLENKASEMSTAGARVATNPKYNADDVGAGVYEAVAGKAAKLKEDIQVTAAGAYNKASELAGEGALVPTTNTIAALDSLMKKYQASKLSDSDATVNFLSNLKNSLLEGTTAGQPELLQQGVTSKFTVPQLRAWLTDFGSKAKGSESLITDVSVSTQKALASQIFGAVKDDLRALSTSTNMNEKAVGRLLMDASNSTRKSVENYNAFIAQGLPKALHEVPLSAVDSEKMLELVKGLSNKQRSSLEGILKDTAPEDLKRIKQVMYDDFVQSARTELPDGSTGVDLKLLARKFNTLKTEERDAVAFAVGTNIDDFSSRMKDAENFFKYQQRYGQAVDGGKAVNSDVVDALSSAAAVSLGYGPAKAVSLSGRIANFFTNGLTDEQTLNLLMSKEAKGLLRDAITSPNSIKTLDKIETTLMKPRVVDTIAEGVQAGAVARENAPTSTNKATQPLESWDIGPAGAEDTTTPDSGTSAEPWDIGAAQKVSAAEIEQKIRAEAEKQGYGQYADMFVRQAKQESGFNPYAVSKKGAAGVFQHMPGTAQELGIDPFDVDQSIAGGIGYMGQQLNKFKDPRLALAAYNWGPGNVAKSGLAGAPAETQNYIKSILGS